MSELATDLPPIILAPPDRGTATVLPAILAQPAPSSVVVVPVGPAADVADLIDSKIAVHRGHATPHPVYDDMQSLRLIYENGLV